MCGCSGKKPDYLGVQKNQQALALCPATKNCISTSENVSDLTHYAPPWYASSSFSLFLRLIREMDSDFQKLYQLHFFFLLSSITTGICVVGVSNPNPWNVT